MSAGAPVWFQLQGESGATCCYCGVTLILAPQETIPLHCPDCGLDGTHAHQVAALRALVHPYDLILEPLRQGTPALGAYAVGLRGADLVAWGLDVRTVVASLIARLPSHLAPLALAGGGWADWPAVPMLQELAKDAMATNAQIEREGGRWRVRPLWTPTTTPRPRTAEEVSS